MSEQKAKHILYVGGFELPDKNAAAQRVLGNAKALRELGYETIFLDVNQEINNDGLSASHDTEGFITYSQRHFKSALGLIKFCTNPLHVEEVLDKHHQWVAVIAYNYPAMALWRLRKICRKRNIKLYGDCTEWHTLQYWKGKFFFIQFDMFFRMRFVQKKLDGVIVISRYLEDYYRRYTKTVIVPPLVDSQAAKWKREAVSSHSDLRLVYFGSPGPHKDMLREIIMAVRDAPSMVCLQIVGVSEEQYTAVHPHDAAIVEQLLQQNKLKFWGRLPHLQALDVVKQADYSIFFRYPTRTSMAGFPTKFVESISCGVPVITTDTSDLKEYAKDGQNAVILPCDTFASKLAELLEAIAQKQAIPPKVNSSLFDYHGYIERLKAFLEDRMV